MSLEHLGIFNQYGLSAYPTREAQVADPTAVLVGKLATAALLHRLNDAHISRAHLLGSWDVCKAQGIAHKQILTNIDGFSDWYLRLDTWAWAPQSITEVPGTRVEFGSPTQEFDTHSTRDAAQAQSDAAVLTWPILLDMSDPRPVLRLLKRFALEGNACWIIDHDRWSSHPTAQNVQVWLEQHGFSVQSSLLDEGYTLYRCTISIDSYAKYLQALGVDADMINVTKLLITTEDADVHPTGGIGTYIKNVRALNRNSGTLLCHLHATQAQMPARTISPQLFVKNITEESYFEGLGLVETAQALLCLFPSLEAFEFQDYRSIGYRLVQSKCTGRLPRWLHLAVILHGSVDYVKFGIGDETAVNYGIHELKYGIKDAYIFQHVDECIAPSKYLAQRLLSEEFGYQLHNPRYVRLPFDLKLLPANSNRDFQQVKRLIYIGKYNRLKGWDDFLQAIELLASTGKLSNITEIVSLAPTAPSREQRSRIEKISAYRPLHLTHTELLQFLAEHRHDSLVVIPSRGENYPFVILEQLLVGTFFVAYDGGGAPEVVGVPEFVNTFFCAPNASALSEKIAEMLTNEPAQYAQTIVESNLRALRRQEETNQEWSCSSAKLPASTTLATLPTAYGIAAKDTGVALPPVAIAIPVYNTSLVFVAELFESILRSKLKPSRVLIVDDGSETNYREALRQLAREKLDRSIPWMLHSQENVGLAGARNSALKLLEEPFIFFLDSDDCLLRHTLQDALIALLLDKRRVATTGFAIYLRASTPAVYDDALKKADFWMPLGTEKARALALFENQFLTANAMVRADVYRTVGGWDAQDRSMWEDWALYSRLAWLGYEFSLIPSPGYLYRTSAGSMSKTYSRYGGRRRLIRNLPFATRLDANVIYSLVNGAGSERSLLNGPALSEREAELIQFIRSLLNRPRLRASILKLYNFYSRIRRKG